ncbi:MAG: prepilin peptidase [Minisyncoccia bacterium]
MLDPNSFLLYFIPVVIFCLGVIIGSFLNVVILRYGTGLSFVSGSSKCFSCSHRLAWYDLVPFFSYIFLRGKCRYCGSKISFQYPLIELISGLIFLFLYFQTFWQSPLFFVSDVIIFSFLLMIAVYDFRHKIIPDGLVYSFIILSLFRVIYFIGLSHILSFPFYLDLLAGPILFLFFYILWAVSSGRWIGFADAKLALGVGWFLGFWAGISAIILSFWIGAIFSIIVMTLGKLNLFSKKLTIKSEVPFAPFIILAVFVEYFLHLDFLYLQNLFH